jgi:hypothetical protein
MRAWSAILASLAIIALAGLAASESAAGGPALTIVAQVADATPQTTGSPPALATPQTEPLPLNTPIPVYEARNVVGRVTIELTDRGFIPSRFENAINQPLAVTLVNTGTRLHTFTIDALDVDVEVPPGETRMLTIPSPTRLGQYTYYSDTPEDRALGMTGIMTVFI